MTKIMVEHLNENNQVERITLEVPEDATIWDWVYWFKSILTFYTYSSANIEELFSEDAYE